MRSVKSNFEARRKAEVAGKVTGPASYFPSIQAKYGQPVDHWFAVLDRLPAISHMDQVKHLKSEFGMGHGHANALVAFHRARRTNA